MTSSYLPSVIQRFEQYKLLAEKAFEQTTDEKLFWQFNAESNSIAIIMKHLSGNMLSRFTDFLSTDGEKKWRKRDAEFENTLLTKDELLQQWNAGWQCLFQALNALSEQDLGKEIFIRNQSHSVMDAINRQLAHYSYHIGQIVFIAKLLNDNSWKSLSIPKGKSDEFNKEKFSQPKL